MRLGEIEIQRVGTHGESGGTGRVRGLFEIPDGGGDVVEVVLVPDRVNIMSPFGLDEVASVRLVRLAVVVE